jgi:hypothetical protein
MSPTKKFLACPELKGKGKFFDTLEAADRYADAREAATKVRWIVIEIKRAKIA